MSTRLAIGLCASAIALLGAASARPSPDALLYNHSPSIPVGFYQRIDAPAEIGTVVTIQAKDVARAYVAQRKFTDDGDRFIKRIAAGPGDVVCAEANRVVINGQTVFYRAQKDVAGRVLPHWSGCDRLQGDEVFVAGDTTDSFDSRYFGPVRTGNIEGVWRFVF